MNVGISKFSAKGSVVAPPSKSFAHRLLIAAALKKGRTVIKNIGSSADVARTCDCLTALGAKITIENGNAEVCGIENLTAVGEVGGDFFGGEYFEDKHLGKVIVLNAGESGATLRFLMPVVAALGIRAEFVCDGGLLRRPVGEMINVLSAHGEKIEKTSRGYVLSGKIHHGKYVIDCSVSSQFASGLAFALPLLSGESTLEITGKPSSESYFDMTLSVLEQSGIKFKKSGYKSIIFNKSDYCLPDETTIPGDFSSAAFMLALGALGGDVTVSGLDRFSLGGQGDEKIIDLLSRFGAEVTVGNDFVRVAHKDINPIDADFSDTPDLAPVVCALAAFAQGKSEFRGVERLKYKESDRLSAIVDMLGKAGIKEEYSNGVLTFFGGEPKGGATFEGFGDHRMVMASAVLASGIEPTSMVKNTECVSKSYPDFFADFGRLGGKIDVGV